METREVQFHRPGSFCWVELSTRNAPRIREFYRSIFDWASTEIPIPSTPDSYSLFSVKDREVCGLYPLTEAQFAQGCPAYWMVYIAVECADHAASKAASLGGRILEAPFDLGRAGRMAILQDPMGALFAVWEARDRIGARLAGVPGTASWRELATVDVEQAGRFYEAMFGWKLERQPMASMMYTLIMNETGTIGGMIELPAGSKRAHSHWLSYFQSDDCDRAASKAESAGGEILIGPRHLHGFGRFAMLADPEGASFALYTPA